MVWMDELSVRCVSEAMDIARIFWIDEAYRPNIWVSRRRTLRRQASGELLLDSPPVQMHMRVLSDDS